MLHRFVMTGTAVLLMMTGLSISHPAGAGEFDDLEEGAQLASFEVEAVYENELGNSMGARFRHVPSRFVLDVLRIQSIPQGFMWVNSPPPSDQGEPHTLEHLLLGKGNKGRYVASLEDMSLGRSSAYTQQRRTCYHFSTEAGKDVFFGLFEAKLDAMLNPTFSDEEIRREVCNVGVVQKEDGSLGLEEKGTVYNEMVSSFERPWSNLFRKLGFMLYGEGHPLSLSSGGYPDAIREMQPEDIRRFHADTHHLNNMGAVVSIGNEIPLEECLERLSAIMSRVEPDAQVGEDPADLWSRLPGPEAELHGEVAVTRFPNQNENEPGVMIYAWRAERTLEPLQEYLLGVFMDLLASGQTSNLYRKFIDSQTREMDLGASAVFSWIEDEPGQPVFVGFTSVNPENCNEITMARVRNMIMDEIRSLSGMEPGSRELEDFNRRALNQVTSDRRDLRVFLNTPPRFGYRGTGSAWIEHLQKLHRKGGFRRNLAGVEEMDAAEELIASGKNFWADYIGGWELLKSMPFAAAATADPGMLAEAESAREGRIREYVSRYREEFGADSDSAAIARYREAYDAATAAIEAEAAGIEMPGFVENPPLSPDPQLDYEVGELPGGGTLVTSNFENITSGTVGLVFGMNVVPESDLVYVAALPTVLRDIGMIQEGVPLAYDEVDELIRRDILSLDVYYSVNYLRERVELAVRGAGSNREETRKALEWMETALFRPDLRPENLPRIRDAVDLELKAMRNRMRRSEESWVNNPVYSYWKQRNPLLLNANCFLTQTHALHRLRWLLKEPPASGDGFQAFVDKIGESAKGMEREELLGVLSTVAEGNENPYVDFSGLDDEAAGLFRDAAEDLRLSLAEIPDASMALDLHYLGDQMTADLAVDPAGVLDRISSLLGMILHQDNVRGFMISNSGDRAALMPDLSRMVSALDSNPSVRQRYETTPLVDSRVRERGGSKDGSIFLALVNENTRSGVHIHTTDCANFETRDPKGLLRFLAARLYGGGGAHSMFMKTWGAGLAYSNGLRSNEANGRLIYYAERCPDLAQTLQFVVGELEKAPYDPTLADYAVAQAFSGNRSGSRYEERGEAMAADLADNLGPEVVAGFREGILELREDPELYDKLNREMESVYGEVLPGYGPSSKEAASRSNAIYYVIGPEKQLRSWEEYLNDVEGDVSLTRIYPRDYWQTLPMSN